MASGSRTRTSSAWVGIKVGAYALCAATISTVTGCGAPDPAKAEGAEAAAPEATSRPKIRISKETTRLTGPLTADGEVDYATAIDERMRQGVTPDNNAAVLFFQALGPAGITEKVRPEFLKRLSVHLPADGNYYVPMKAYYEKLPEYAPKKPDESWDAYHERTKPWEEVLMRPWTAAEFPHVKAWLDANEKPLELVVQGTRRPRFYEAHMRCRLHRQLARIVLLLAAYRAERGEYPETLAALGSGERLISDPFTDEPLHYIRKGNGYALYSPGPDGKAFYGTKDYHPQSWSDDVVVLTPNVREAEAAAAAVP